MADSEFKVNLANYGRKFWYMRYTDPITGKTVAKSTGTAIKKDALKIAGQWEADLLAGRHKPTSKVLWSEFRQRYEDEVLNGLGKRTAGTAATVFNAVEKLIAPDRLAKLDANQISKFQQKLRDERKLSENSVKSYLAHLQAALNWAKRVKLLSEVPTFEKTKRAKTGKVMKGRPFTEEEFERILGKVPEVIGAASVDRWRWFLRGLWFSGLRLSEAINLSWDEAGSIMIDVSGKYPMFAIPGDKQKSGQDQLLPVAPEFAEMLLAVPQDERTGSVFRLGERNDGRTPLMWYVSRTVGEIGELAGVIVNQSPKKFASAHDFRRSFGERWSSRVMPAILQQMMRHADISTTMKFYVGQNAQRAAADIYAAFAAKKVESCNTSRNTSEIAASKETSELTQPDSANNVV